jgi:hypothetical protein
LSLNAAILNCAHGRGYYITEKERMAIVPPYTKKGDIIAIFWGGQTPFVLRQKDHGHELIGEGHFHRVMDGEIWKEEEVENTLLI